MYHGVWFMSARNSSFMIIPFLLFSKTGMLKIKQLTTTQYMVDLLLIRKLVPTSQYIVEFLFVSIKWLLVDVQMSVC